MRKLLALPVLAAAAVLLAGCSSLDHGAVTGKQYEAGYWWTDSICASWGKYGCQLYIPYQEWQPECWKLDLASGKDTGSVCVDRATWDAKHAGEQYP